MRRVLAAGSAVALTLVLACSRDEGPVRIGAIYPTSGSQATYGAEELRGVQAAVELLNARGGVNGRRIALEVADAPDVDAAWRAAHRFARDDVGILIGSYGSTLSLAAGEVAHREGVLYWETGAVADLVTARGYPEVFRTGPSGATLAEQAARFATEVVAPRYGIGVERLRVAVVYEDDPYGTSVGEGIARQARERRFRLVASYGYDPAAEDFRGIVRALRRARPDVLVAATYLEDGARLRRRILEDGLPLKALVGKCAAFYTREMAAILGRNIDGVFVADKPKAVGRRALTPEARALEATFSATFRERFGHEPDAAAYMGFSGAWALLAEVLPRARSLDLDDLRAAALSVDLPDGSLVNGAGVKFAPPGDPMAGQNLRAFGVVWQWQDGEPVIVYPRDAARGSPRWG